MNFRKQLFQKLRGRISPPFYLQSLAILILIQISILFGSTAYAQNPPPARVVIAKIEFQTLARNHPFIGTFYYDRISHVSSEISGLATRVEARAGDRVNMGQPLVHLDTQLLDQEMIIHRNLVDQAELLTTHRQKNFQRMKSLHKTESISEKEHEDAEFLYREAVLKKMSATAILKKLEIQKKKSLIQAPFDGIVLEKNIESGDWVQPGKILMGIGSVNDLFVQVPVAETLLKFVSLGQSVPLTINAYDQEIMGTIDSLSPLADAKTKNVFLKIKIPMVSRVAQNMSATVFIPTGKVQRLAMIPRDALVQSQGKDFVFTTQDGKARMLEVNIVTHANDRIGADNDHFIEGMPIVIDGNERLRPDQPVVLVEAN